MRAESEGLHSEIRDESSAAAGVDQEAKEGAPMGTHRRFPDAGRRL